MSRRRSLRGVGLRSTRSLLARCIPTADNVRGPFYRAGAPFRVRLADEDEPGQRLTISGRLTGLPDCRPLGGAVLDVWQTNARGLYSNLLGIRDPHDPKTFRLRGRFRTSAEGFYRIDTIVPGHYPLGFLTRPRHIHLVATSPAYRTLVTQLFFAGDRYLARDPWVKDELVIELIGEDSPGTPGPRYHGHFDIALERSGAREEGRRGRALVRDALNLDYLEKFRGH